MMRVILVARDRLYATILGKALSKHGVTVEVLADSEALVDSFDTVIRGDIVVLGPSLPKASGVALLAKLYLIGINLPIVDLADDTWLANERSASGATATGLVDSANGVEALVENLKHVIEAIAPPPDRQPSKRLVLGRLSLELDHNRTYWDKMEVSLTEAECEIVRALALNFGRHISYETIYRLRRVGGSAARTDAPHRRRIVRSAVKRIRNKFRACDPTFVEIENYAAFGYRWAGPGAGDLIEST